MAPHLLGNSYIPDSAEPVQIIGKPGLQHEYNRFPKQTTAKIQPPKSDQPQYRWQIVWRNVIAFIYLHTFALYGLYLCCFVAQWKTVLWCYFVAVCGGQGITAGAHRLWAHRTYKAKLPLRILLAFFQTLAFQNHILEWVRDHRVHHKFTDSDADPHNASRGFFFSHIGWLMLKKHKDVKTKGQTMDLSDLLEDPVVRFQKKYYVILMPICCFVLPVVAPVYFWGENWWVSWYTAGIFRYTFSLNGTWLVNSAAHIWGNKPYDKSIKPTENAFVSAIAFGEGWHNYHHVFPWDYKTAELGNYRLNFTTAFIDFMYKIGWAYDLKTASHDMILKRMKRTGDDNDNDGQKHEEIADNGHGHHHYGEMVWGWGDQDMDKEEVDDVKKFNALTEK